MTRMRIVPEKMTVSMHNALLDKVASTDGFDNWIFHADAGYEAAIAASPAQGCVTAAQLEAAAEALYLDRFARNGEKPAYRWADERWAKDTWDRIRQDAKAVLMGAGLTVRP